MSSGRSLLLASLAAALGAPAGALAQAGPTAPPADSGNAVVTLRVGVSAREIRFNKDPRVLVRLLGAAGDSVRVVERRNLPDPVVPGTTYRDVFIAVEIMGRASAECIAARLAGADSLQGARCDSLVTFRRSRP